MSTVTKQALEASLKHMLLKKPLDKITIRDLTEDCGVSRMTFYYHFQDIYDLVEWACIHDAREALAGKKTYADWPEGLAQIFEAVLENKPFVLNAYRALERGRMERFLYHLTADLIRGVVDECSQGTAISEEDKATILETLKYWEGKSMEDIAAEAMPSKIKELEKDDIICVGLENGVSGETTCDHDKILAVGLRGYIEECQRNIDAIVPQTMEEQAKVDFWNACIIQCRGLITYARRMAEEAERQASLCKDEKRRKELLTIAENCRVVPENPPRTFWQAVQMIWFIHVYFYIEVCTTA